MIIDCISDLHGYYPQLEGGDLLIVAGDLTATDRPGEYEDFRLWIKDLKYTNKIVVGGNHDNYAVSGLFSAPQEYFEFTYLCDSGCIVYEHPGPKPFHGLGLDLRDLVTPKLRPIKIWGSPWTLRFPGMNPKCMAFTVDTEEELAVKFSLIPEDTDIVITHMPPFGILDEIKRGRTLEVPVGSTSLTKKLDFCPKLHVFGHVHEGYGKWERNYFKDKKTIFVNASHVNSVYDPVNKPIRVEL